MFHIDPDTEDEPVALDPLGAQEDVTVLLPRPADPGPHELPTRHGHLS